MRGYVSCGFSHVVSVDNDGHIWVFGGNFYGQLGLPEFVEAKLPVRNPTLKQITSVSCGSYHTVCISGNFEVYAFGRNDSGQLGLGEFDSSNYTHRPPTKVDGLPKNVYKVCCGTENTFCITSNGDVWSFGRNDYGQLGPSELPGTRCSPKQTYLSNIVGISAGSFHTVCWSESRFAMGFGCNNDGQLGIERDTGPFKVPIRYKDYPDIISVSCGRKFTLLLQSNGTVWCCGENSRGELGRAPSDSITSFQRVENLPRVTEISSGYSFSICVDENGRLWFFGVACTDKIPGLKAHSNTETPIIVPDIENVAMLSEGGSKFVVKDENFIWVFDNDSDRYEPRLHSNFMTVIGDLKLNRHAKSARK